MVTVIGGLIALKFEMSYREDKLPNIFNSESFTKRAKPGMDWKFSLLYLIGMTVHLKTLAWLCNFFPFSLQQICISCLDQAFEPSPRIVQYSPLLFQGPTLSLPHILAALNSTISCSSGIQQSLGPTRQGLNWIWHIPLQRHMIVQRWWAPLCAWIDQNVWLCCSVCSNWRQQYHLIFADSHLTGCTLL